MAERPAAPLEPVVDVQTMVGQLLVHRGDQVIGAVLQSDGAWEVPESIFVRSVLGPGKTFVDVGAHVGYFSVLGSRCVGPTGAVIAVEPEARNLDLLERNLARNGCHNVRVVPFAAHATARWMSLALDHRNRGAHRLVPAGQAETAVRCVRLDDLLPATVDVVKVDAQGYDHEVIFGMARTVADNPQIIVVAELSVEELGRRKVDPAVVLAGYEAMGFTLSTLDRFGRRHRASADAVLAQFGAPGTSDFSVILERTPPRGMGDAPDTRPRRCEGLAVDEVPDGLVVFQPEAKRFHRLNQTAAAIFDLCTGEWTATQIAACVQELYELSDPPAAEVANCLDHLSAEGLIV